MLLASLRISRLCALLAVLFGLPVLTAFGQAAPSVKGGIAVHHESAVEHAAAVQVHQVTAGQGGAQESIYLPLICQGKFTATPIVFGTGFNEDGSFANQGTTFDEGILELYNATTVEMCGSVDYRMEWTWPDGEIVNVSGAVSSPGALYTKILYVEPQGLPLPTGTYTTRLFINGELLQQATATIQ